MYRESDNWLESFTIFVQACHCYCWYTQYFQQSLWKYSVIWLEKRLREAYEKLKKRGIPLASNQVNYSLIYRAPEENGVKSACDELGITIIAYSPIAQGELLFIVYMFYYIFFIIFFQFCIKYICHNHIGIRKVFFMNYNLAY